MLEELVYTKIPKNRQKIKYGKGAELGMGLVAAFGVVAIITIIIYKLYASASGDITLPGGFKFKFTT